MQEGTRVCHELQERDREERCGKKLFVAFCSGFYLESLFIKMFAFTQAISLWPGCSLHLLPSLLLFELKLFP